MSHLPWKFKTVRLQAQVAEVIGDDNVWFCSECYNQPVKDIDLLWRYFVEHGGAADFAARWEEAMSRENRYFAFQCFGHEVTDERVLWEYYNSKCGAQRRARMLAQRDHRREDRREDRRDA